MIMSGHKLWFYLILHKNEPVEYRIVPLYFTGSILNHIH